MSNLRNLLVIEVGGVPVRVAPNGDSPEAIASFKGLIRRLKTTSLVSQTPQAISEPSRQVRVLLSVDFDAVSGWLGTGQHPRNCLADYSSGFFAGHVGVSRLIRLFKRLDVADKMTWFIPGHSMETFPVETQLIHDSGAEVALHGYCHEDCTRLSTQQEKDIFEKCIKLAQSLTGKKPVGYRAPLYRYLPNVENSHGYVPSQSIERMWQDRFAWLWNHGPDGEGPADFVFPLILHPDTSGMAHIIGTIESMILWMKGHGTQVEFVTYETVARSYLSQKRHA
ncbi:Peptidoglycan deacetylase [Colletotrichum gloeosporioides]|uniref:Peptidoglycan deacetylase n=1 Tax=Colletotrichum gloeosporioides TaxID=474922 RepID=A0A8H4CKG4_COLGL|nr:Peptidoglycan deacetylase [Colletotrichum gloeosporioides]KAF3805511.1 Peptidoglycan deacetylase [Colletotrichum gloeosporioides]